MAVRPRPLLVYFHGNAGNVTLRAPAAIDLAMQGIDVFVFDYRGFGRSEGRASESALRVDSLAAYDYAVSHFKGYEGRVALYGESIGGAYAAWVASQRDVRCVVVESSFSSLAAEVNAIYRPLPMGIFVPLSLPVLRWLNAAGKPVLVAHGRRDEVVPFEVGMRLYDRLRVPKEVFISETAGHCEVPAVEGARYAEAVARFIDASGASTRLE
ncbi:MAG: alpha/beta hydrolase [Thermoanaerobaculia bacterium]